MGFDGAEIKRLRLLKEQENVDLKQADAPPPVPQDLQQQPQQDDCSQPDNPRKSILISAFNSIARIAGATLLGIVVLGIIANFFVNDNSRRPSHNLHQPSSPESTNPSQSTSSYTPAVGYADAVAAVLNTSYGNVCQAEIHGFFSKTIKIDWTVNTNKLHMMKVFAEIGSVKEKLYEDGVRYFQFPNDAGTYNVIDWKTGEKNSISDRAPYYFSD